MEITDNSRPLVYTSSNETPLGIRYNLNEKEQMLFNLLLEHGDKPKERVEATVNKYRQSVRTLLRDDLIRMSLSPKSEDTKVQVPITVVNGVPTDLLKVIEPYQDPVFWILVLHQNDIDYTVVGLQVLETYYGNIQSWLNNYKRDDTLITDISRSLLLSVTLQKFLRETDLINQITTIKEDVLGNYFHHKKTIEIYWMSLALYANILRVPLEMLTIATLAHELGHAYTHLGHDIDDQQWDTEDYMWTNRRIVEGFAQYYAEQVCLKLIQREPTLLATFRTRTERQPYEYRAYQNWAKNTSKRGEVIRMALILTRNKHIRDYDTFWKTLEETEKSLNR